jgi:hypothetical protein
LILVDQIPAARSDSLFAIAAEQQTGRIDVDRVEAEQFTAELAAAMTVIIAQLKSSQYTR